MSDECLGGWLEGWMGVWRVGLVGGWVEGMVEEKYTKERCAWFF